MAHHACFRSNRAISTFVALQGRAFMRGRIFLIGIDHDGAEVVFVSTQDLVGTNPGNAYNIFRATVDGSTITQVTNSTTGFVRQVKISGDGSVIVFTTDSDLTGGNPLNDLQVFSMNADGTNIAQVTIGATFAEKIAFSDDEQRIAWQGLRDPFGTNADGSREIFAINIDGTNHMQLTMSAGDSWDPRISDDGSRIAFGSRAAFPPEVNADGEYEVYVVNGDGTGMVRITDSDRESGTSEGGALASFDISGNGQWVVFTSEGDLRVPIPTIRIPFFGRQAAARVSNSRFAIKRNRQV